MSLNRAMIIGNLGEDPEIRYTSSGVPVVSFSLATDESHLDKEGKRQERVTWHRIVVMGKLALVCREYLKKGRQVFAEGRLRYADWKGDTGRRKQHRAEIIAVRVQFLGPPPEASQPIEPDSPISTADADITF